ncbi:MAG: DUF3102 domain-containing protein [Peptococcaceae bacterium]|nr:MAG: DUF3102 domain-containing protein [Peptococcaceae bacterium]
MEKAVAIQRTPELIAAEINNIKKQTRTMALYNSIEIGRRLAEAKLVVPHGEWGKWLERSVEYSKSTANNLMRIFEEYGPNQLSLLGDNANFQALGDLSYTQAVALLGVEEREKFIEEHDLENMSTRDLQQAIKEKNEALRKLEIAQKAAVEKSEEAQILSAEKFKIEANLQTTDQVLRKAQDSVKMLQDALQKEKDESKSEIKKLQQSMADMKKQLSEAQASGNTDEVDRLSKSLVKTDNELTKALEKIEELERQLREKPIEAPVATIEKIPDEVQKELDELRNKTTQQGTNAAALKFKVYFDELVDNFKSLLGVLAEIDETERYKKAVLGLIEKMSERLA